jgi:undecaprenyl pyrophosphate synthase
MPVGDEESVKRLNKLISSSEGTSIDVDLIINALVGNDSDEEINELVKMALESLNEGISLRDLAEGIINLYIWRENLC